VTPRTNAPELPLAGYDALLAEEIVGRLDTLDRAELQVLLAHERATDRRTTVIDAIEARLR
jgi:hypothetical protein